MLISIAGVAQQIDSININPTDSSAIRFHQRVEKIFREGADKSMAEFNQERNDIKREKIIDNIQKTTLRAKGYLKHVVDSVKITKELDDIKRWLLITGDGVFINKESLQTHRNLVTTSKILLELLDRANTRKSQLDAYEKELVSYRYVLDSLNSDSSLYHFPTDSVTLIKYLQKYYYVARLMQPVDSNLNVAITRLYGLQAMVNYEVYQLHGNIEEVDGYQKQLSVRVFDRDLPNLTEPPRPSRPFSEIHQASKTKGELMLYFYAKNHSGRILLVLLVIIASTLFLRSLKEILVRENLLRSDFAGQLVLRYPFLSALILVLTLFQFIFPEPPFIFNIIFWVLPAIALTFVMNKYITRYWMYFWLIMLMLFIAACYGNLILQSSRIERWGMLFVALAGVIAGSYFFFSGHRKQLREKLILYFIGLAILLELASAITNINGRYNLSKSLFIIGYLNVIVGILFLWTIRLINEGLTLASSVYTRQDKKLFYINFERVGEKAPMLLYVLLIIAWFIVLGRNFYAFRLITDPFRNFFFKDRTIGDFSFTVNNILIFFIVMIFAVVTSRVISFFASDKHPMHSGEDAERKVRLGSWLLLIRVAVISAGLFMALVASGFPLDKVTIILGALGVGVGFGLQGLVGHLVSGVVIAFEKPVNVGDIVEIGGQVGTMKSIGFRSSVVSSQNGADIIIPNGDILNAHLINWTLGGSKRQLEITLGLAYKTDLQKTRQLLMDLLGNTERVLKYPNPVVQFDKFDSGSVFVKINFWVHDYREGASVKSTVISAIDETFKNHDIHVAFPQQEIHIHNDGEANSPKP